MVRTTLNHRPGEGPRPGGGAPAGGRAPAALLPRLLKRRRGSPRRHPRLTVLQASVCVAGLCMLAACALVAPGFVLGAEGVTVDGSTQEALRSPSAQPTVPAVSVPGATRSGATRSGESIVGTMSATPATVTGATATPETAGEAAPPAAASAAVDAAAAFPTGGDLLVTLPWGSGPGEVGLLQPGEGLARGPEALAVAPNGRIAVLDSVNGRLLFLDPSGEPVGTAAISLTSPRFLAVDDDRLFVVDSDADCRLVTFDWSGANLGAMTLPDLNDVVTGLFATDQGPCLEISHETVLLLAQTTATLRASAVRSEPARAMARTVAGRPTGRGLGHAVRVTFRPGGNARFKFFEIDAASLRPIQTGDSSPVLASGHPIEHLMSVDGDGAGGLIVGVRLLKPELAGGQKASLALTRLAPSKRGGRADDGSRGSVETVVGSIDTVTDTMLLADSSFAYLGQPYIVAPDGRIFQTWGNEAGYSIVVHCFVEAEEVQP